MTLQPPDIERTARYYIRVCQDYKYFQIAGLLLTGILFAFEQLRVRVGLDPGRQPSQA
jgi:hypothetical protein